jgi:hypothetical protein
MSSSFSTRHNLPFWLTVGSIIRGWVLSVSREPIEGVFLAAIGAEAPKLRLRCSKPSESQRRLADCMSEPIGHGLPRSNHEIQKARSEVHCA